MGNCESSSCYPRDDLDLRHSREVESVATASEQQSQTNVAGKTGGGPGHKRIAAVAIFALCLNAAAAVYTSSPSDFALPDVNRLAQLLPHTVAPAQVPQTVVAALDDIRTAQTQLLA